MPVLNIVAWQVILVHDPHPAGKPRFTFYRGTPNREPPGGFNRPTQPRKQARVSK